MIYNKQDSTCLSNFFVMFYFWQVSVYQKYINMYVWTCIAQMVKALLRKLEIMGSNLIEFFYKFFELEDFH